MCLTLKYPFINILVLRQFILHVHQSIKISEFWIFAELMFFFYVMVCLVIYILSGLSLFLIYVKQSGCIS